MTDRIDEIRQRCDAGRTVRITDVKYLLSEVDRLNALHKREIIVTGEYAQRVIDLTARAEKAKAERDKAAEFIRWVDDNFSHYMPQEYTGRLMALAGKVATGKEEND